MEYTLEEFLQKKIDEKIDKRLKAIPKTEEFRSPAKFEFDSTSSLGNGLVAAFVERRAKEIAAETEEKLRAIYLQGYEAGVTSVTKAPVLAEGTL